MRLAALRAQLATLLTDQPDSQPMVWKVLYAQRRQPLLVPSDIPQARRAIAFFIRNPLLRLWGNLLLTIDRWLPGMHLLPSLELEQFPHHTFFSADATRDTALLWGCPGPLQKLTIYCPAPDGTLGQVAKVAMHLSANDAIAREAHQLDKLGKLPQIARFLPTLLRQGTLSCGRRYLSMQSLPQGVSSAVFTRGHAEFLRILADQTLFFEKWHNARAYLRLESRTHQVLPLVDEDLRRLLLETLAEIELGIGQRRLPTCLSHGDFAPWNLRENDGELYALDWEYAETSGNPLQDFLHFHLIQRALGRWPLRAGTMVALLEKATSYADRQFGRDSGVAAARGGLALYYLLDIVTFYVASSGHMDFSHPVLRAYLALLKQREDWLPRPTPESKKNSRESHHEYRYGR